MRKNQLKNREKRQARNQAKRSVTRTEKTLKNKKSHIKVNIGFLIFFVFLIALMLLNAYVDLNPDRWKQNTITYESHYYIRVWSGGYAGMDDCYVIVDNENNKWRIAAWSDDFNEEKFAEDVKPGDKLYIRWYNWMFDKQVVTLESNNNVYFSYEAEVAERAYYGKQYIIGALIFTLFLILTTCFLARNILKMRKIKSELDKNKDMYIEYLHKEK